MCACGMFHRIGLREKLFFAIIFVLVMFSITYLYLCYVQAQYKDIKWSEHRCMSDLASAKAQLNVVTEYKNRLDKFLSDLQKSQEAQKEQCKEYLDSCVAMKQQAVICQNQFEDLQSECRKVKEKYNQVAKELEKLKTNR